MMETPPVWERRQDCAGATLVEAMIAIVILAVLAIAGMEYVVRAQSTIAVQRLRQDALAVANGRLEALRAFPMSWWTNQIPVGGATWYLREQAGGWQVNATAPSPAETKQGFRIETAARYEDLAERPGGYDAIRLTVVVWPRANRNDGEVRLETLEGY